MQEGCVIAQNLFNFFFATAFTQALHELPVGVALRFKINGKLFDLSWSHNDMKALVHELVYVNHAAIVSNDWTKLQLLANSISSAIADWVLVLSVLKTTLKVMAQLNQELCPLSTLITVDRAELENVTSFKHLGSTMSSSLALDEEINNRIAHASQAVASLNRI